tara:strand:- start:1394 stop:2074 length:681 start_codon:yes stop_codon:yes gene_type:complete
MFSVVIPLYNEADNINQLITEIDTSLIKHNEYEIVLINDCSMDNTLEIIKKIKNKKIKILNNSTNKGQSFSIHYGVKNSLYNIIITLDGDGQNDPADIPNLLKFFLDNPSFKLVGGIRAKRKDNFIKIISSKIANKIRSKIFNDDCADTGCSLKVFDKKIFLSFPYFDGIHRFLPALFKGFGFQTKFLSVNHRKRKYGVSNYGTFKRLIKGIRDIFKVKKILKEIN